MLSDSMSGDADGSFPIIPRAKFTGVSLLESHSAQSVPECPCDHPKGLQLILQQLTMHKVYVHSCRQS